MINKKIIGGELIFDFKSLDNNKKNKKIVKKNSGTWSVNGRSALYLILNKIKKKGINHIHLPSFICSSVLQPIKKLKLNYSFYPVDENLNIEPDNNSSNSALLLIHYFGKVNKISKSFQINSNTKINLIEDATHVFLNKNFNLNNINSSIFFSLRKFAPVMMGGWCNIKQKVSQPNAVVDNIALKLLSAKLLKTLYLKDKKSAFNQKTENYYLKLFNECEAKMNKNIMATDIPKFVKKTINKINWQFVLEKRRKNWKILDHLIGNRVEKVLDKLPNGSAPIGYIIKIKNRDKIRKELAKKRIFAPILWNLPREISKKRFPNSCNLSNTILSLPIDQSYNLEDMEKMAKHFIKII